MYVSVLTAVFVCPFQKARSIGHLKRPDSTGPHNLTIRQSRLKSVVVVVPDIIQRCIRLDDNNCKKTERVSEGRIKGRSYVPHSSLCTQRKRHIYKMPQNQSEKIPVNRFLLVLPLTKYVCMYVLKLFCVMTYKKIHTYCQKLPK